MTEPVLLLQDTPGVAAARVPRSAHMQAVEFQSLFVPCCLAAPCSALGVTVAGCQAARGPAVTALNPSPPSWPGWGSRGLSRLSRGLATPQHQQGPWPPLAPSSLPAVLPVNKLKPQLLACIPALLPPLRFGVSAAPRDVSSLPQNIPPRQKQSTGRLSLAALGRMGWE